MYFLIVYNWSTFTKFSFLNSLTDKNKLSSLTLVYTSIQFLKDVLRIPEKKRSSRMQRIKCNNFILDVWCYIGVLSEIFLKKKKKVTTKQKNRQANVEIWFSEYISTFMLKNIIHLYIKNGTFSCVQVQY